MQERVPMKSSSQHEKLLELSLDDEDYPIQEPDSAE